MHVIKQNQKHESTCSSRTEPGLITLNGANVLKIPVVLSMAILSCAAQNAAKKHVQSTATMVDSSASLRPRGMETPSSGQDGELQALSIVSCLIPTILIGVQLTLTH